MKRRVFIAATASMVAWPLAVRAQQPPVIGVLSGTNREQSQMAAIQQGLKEAGYIDGRDVTIEYRWAEGQFDRLPAMAADLVRRRWR